MPGVMKIPGMRQQRLAREDQAGREDAARLEREDAKLAAEAAEAEKHPTKKKKNGGTPGAA